MELASRYIPIGPSGNTSLPSEIDINSSEVGVSWEDEFGGRGGGGISFNVALFSFFAA